MGDLILQTFQTFVQSGCTVGEVQIYGAPDTLNFVTP